MDPFLGEIRIFAGNFAPRSWALCNGQLLSIAQNTALFSILGTNFGGDGRVTFGLPNLQGSTAMAQGDGPGLTPRQVGETGGEPAVTLTTVNLPSHNHSFTGQSFLSDQNSPNGNYVGGNRTIFAYVAPNAPNLNLQPMNPIAVSTAGSSQPHNNMQPYQCLTYIIALQGIFPPRS